MFLLPQSCRQLDFQLSCGFHVNLPCTSPPVHSNKDLFVSPCIDLDCSLIPVRSASQVCRLGIPHALNHITLLSMPHDLINLSFLLPLLLRLAPSIYSPVTVIRLRPSVLNSCAPGSVSVRAHVFVTTLPFKIPQRLKHLLA